ncbi:GDSL esterase/lipase [Acorus calamus]|uniref:GDSL esterase/lipase n=1 Tax=Acorus calamus TaxID=4465 RepID=A0AAV9BYD0_ACOCL|nr:GDSL esterase/lipase [Acorus calamus]
MGLQMLIFLRRSLLMWAVGSAALSTTTGEAKCAFTAIFNFGDSNSDTGGFWAAFPSTPNPNGMTYFKRPAGRASDGRLVIDFLGLSPFALPIQLNQMKEFKSRVLQLQPKAPIGCYPSFLTELPHSDSELDEHGCMTTYNNAVKFYNNDLLKGMLRQTREALRDATIVYVDTHSVKLELFSHPKEHGLAYGTKACCGYGGGAYNFNPKVYCGNTKEIDGQTVTATACADPHNYVSWDGVHTTEAANKLIALAVIDGSYFDPPFPLSQLCDLQPIG